MWRALGNGPVHEYCYPFNTNNTVFFHSGESPCWEIQIKGKLCLWKTYPDCWVKGNVVITDGMALNEVLLG